MAAQDHPCFKPPSDLNIKIWRYMDFTKYVSFLDSKSLFFSRSDLFDDPYEGALSHHNIRIRPEFYKDSGIPVGSLEGLSKFREHVRQWIFVNCWHMNEHESAAMWKLYARTNEAVAIQSTYNNFKECLPEEVFLGIVNYIDYEKEWLPEDNMLWPFVHKRKSFEHERELRAVIQELGSANLPNSELGRLISVNLEKLVKSINISPSAPEWFADGEKSD